MKYKMILWIAIFWSTASGSVAHSASLISNYQDLLGTLTSGNRVNIVTRLGLCSLEGSQSEKQNSDSWKNVIGGMEVSAFNKHTISEGEKVKHVIATSLTMLVEHPSMGNVLNYVRWRFFEDNTVELLSSFIDPRTYSTLHQTKLKCSMSNGKEQKGISVFERKN